jgi:hypothetical protein
MATSIAVDGDETTADRKARDLRSFSLSIIEGPSLCWRPVRVR